MFKAHLEAGCRAGRFRVRVATAISAVVWALWPAGPVTSDAAPPSGEPQARKARPALAAEVRAALAENVRALSPVTVSWTTTYRSDLPIADAVRIGKFIEGDSFFEPRHVDIIRQGNKYSYLRKTWVHPGGGRRNEASLHSKFDGKNLYLGNHWGGEIESLVVWTPERRAGQTGLVYEAEYFERAGFRLYGLMDQLEHPDESLILSQLDEGAELAGAGPATIAGAPRYRLELIQREAKRRLLYDLDPARRYAVLRYEERTLDDRPVRLTENLDFIAFSAPDAWLPSQSRTRWWSWYSMGGAVQEQPLLIEEIRVVRLDKQALPDDTFVIEAKRPGALVADSRLPGASKRYGGVINYQVPARAEDLAAVIDAAIKGEPYKPSMRTFRMRGILIAANVAVLVLVLAIYGRRSRRRIGQ